MRTPGFGMALLFLVVNTATAKRCGGQDPGSNAGFLRNLMLVSISAVQKVKQRTNLPDEQIQAMFKRNFVLIENGVGRYIDD